MTGPECDWCKASGWDMDVNQVGSEYVCNDCLEVATSGRELLAALKQLVAEATSLGWDCSHITPVIRRAEGGPG